MKAVVFGASGLVGRHLVNQLLNSSAWQEVVVAGRNPLPLKHPKLTQVEVDFSSLNEHASLFEVDAVFSCLGTTMAKAGSRDAFRQVDFNYNYQVAKLTAEAGAKRFLLVSAYGASVSSPFFYSRVKGQLEEAVSELEIPRVVFLQPSLLLGKREEFRLTEQSFGSIANYLKPLWRNLRGPWWPVEAEAVAKAMAVAALLPQDAPIVRWQYAHIMAAGKEH